MSISLASLNRAVTIAEKIEALETELASILGQRSAPVTKAEPAPEAEKPARKNRRKMSAKAKAAIGAAQTLRWAKIRDAKK